LRWHENKFDGGGEHQANAHGIRRSYSEKQDQNRHGDGACADPVSAINNAMANPRRYCISY